MASFLYTIIIYPLQLVIGCVFTLFFRITNNYGLSIIGVSIGVTLLCLPLYAVAERWQEIERQKQKSMNAQLNRIKKAFTGDERYMMTTAYYRQQHYSPFMALRSSFGLLIQIPFFIAAYHFLHHLEPLKGTSFLFIRDMGAPDELFKIGSFPINVLPIAMTLINCVSGALYTKGLSLRDKLQVYLTAAVFLVILYPSPSGLVLYWTFNNIFSMVKNIFYKLKNPLKSFWIFSCALLSLAGLYVLFFFTTKWKYKAIFVLLLVVVYTLPYILKFVNSLITGILFSIYSDKKRRCQIYFLSCAVLFVLTGFVIPMGLISSSPIEFSNISIIHPNPLYFVGQTALQSAGIFFFWASCIYFLFNKNVQTILAYVFASLSVCALFNTFLFVIAYGDISAALYFLNVTDFKTVSVISAINLLFICAIFALIPYLLRLKKGTVCTSIFYIVIFAMGAISVLNFASIKHSYDDFVANSVGKSESEAIEPVFYLSKSNPNVMLFMLDKAQAQYIPAILEESPDLAEIYSGFVFYNNCVAFNGHTLEGSPGIFGGYEYTPYEMNLRDKVPLKEKHNEALVLAPRILTEQKGFSALLTDSSWANYSDYFDTAFIEPYPQIKGQQLYAKYSALWSKEHLDGQNIGNAEAVLKRNLLFFSLFRESPIAIRELIYKKGTYWNPDENARGIQYVIDWYSSLDYLKELTTISDDAPPFYSSVVNEFTHESALLQAPDYVPVTKVTNLGTSVFKEDTSYPVVISALKRIGEWIEYLKENGVYDNTRIIIVSDHGCYNSEWCIEKDDSLDAAMNGGQYSGRGHYHPLLLYKDFNSNGSLKEDDTFMTNADCLSLTLCGLVENPVNPFTQKNIPLDTTNIKKDGVIVSINDLHVPGKHGKYKFNIKDSEWWVVKDSIFKADSWHRLNE